MTSPQKHNSMCRKIDRTYLSFEGEGGKELRDIAWSSGALEPNVGYCSTRETWRPRSNGKNTSEVGDAHGEESDAVLVRS